MDAKNTAASTSSVNPASFVARMKALRQRKAHPGAPPGQQRARPVVGQRFGKSKCGLIANPVAHVNNRMSPGTFKTQENHSTDTGLLGKRHAKQVLECTDDNVEPYSGLTLADRRVPHPDFHAHMQSRRFVPIPRIGDLRSNRSFRQYMSAARKPSAVPKAMATSTETDADHGEDKGATQEIDDLPSKHGNVPLSIADTATTHNIPWATIGVIWDVGSLLRPATAAEKAQSAGCPESSGGDGSNTGPVSAVEVTEAGNGRGKSRQYRTIKVTDLKENSVNVILFGEAADATDEKVKGRTPPAVGQVVALFDPALLKATERYSSVGVSVNYRRQIVILGHSPDLSTCAGKRAGGRPCPVPINRHRSHLCAKHLELSFQKFRGARMEFASGTNGIRLIDPETKQFGGLKTRTRTRHGVVLVQDRGEADRNGFHGSIGGRGTRDANGAGGGVVMYRAEDGTVIQASGNHGDKLATEEGGKRKVTAEDSHET
ncbi:hypothetical protein IWQ60_003044 [Tieghemiomyces parasiticus]|uniref:Zinc finger Mcm10/DnaG-type domain-containing protein n=1 Tax=Tieghemiomyces parasiticus TaxID=78921 RepID=A0A9W8AII8_9FUNG|nr:hypothetical protein IWQ60_003044 [Tieghemiomyces parasiticus]